MAFRTLELTRTYRRRLLHLRMLCGASADPELLHADVERVERILGHKLGDSLLALLALRTSLLDELEVRLTMLPRHTKDVHAAGLSQKLIGIGRQSDGNTLMAARADGTAIYRIHLASGEITELPVEAWLDSLCVLQQERLRDASGEARARMAKSVTDEAVDGFFISILEGEVPIRAHHAKFGDGDILRELGADKVEVRFDSGDVKTLMRSFLTIPA